MEAGGRGAGAGAEAGSDEALKERRARVEASVAEARAAQASSTSVRTAAGSKKKSVPAPPPIFPINAPMRWALRVIAAVVLVFYFSRMPEIISLVSRPLYAFMMLVSVLGLLTISLRPPAELGSLVKRLGLIALVVASIKNDMDNRLRETMETHVWDLTGYTAVVTGANGGVGFSTVKHLYQQGAHVIMACRNLEKCEAAAKEVESSKLLSKFYNVTYCLYDIYFVNKP
jgi:3-oxoacyl-ACP reductase-like protein